MSPDRKVTNERDGFLSFVRMINVSWTVPNQGLTLFKIRLSGA